MNGYAAAVRQFYDIYRPIARKYGLRMSSHTSIYDDGWIKIYKGEGADRQQIIKKEPKRKEEVRKQYAFPCGGCVCSHCANNVETPDTCTGEMKEPCFTCDYCKHYDGKGTDRRLQDCDKYIVTDEHARRLRRHMKIINRRKAHQ